MARALADYNNCAWPTRETSKNLDWLSTGRFPARGIDLALGMTPAKPLQ